MESDKLFYKIVKFKTIFILSKTNFLFSYEIIIKNI